MDGGWWEGREDMLGHSRSLELGVMDGDTHCKLSSVQSVLQVRGEKMPSFRPIT